MIDDDKRIEALEKRVAELEASRFRVIGGVHALRIALSAAWSQILSGRAGNPVQDTTALMDKMVEAADVAQPPAEHLTGDDLKAAHEAFRKAMKDLKSDFVMQAEFVEARNPRP